MGHDANPRGIARDGRSLWFTEYSAGKIGQISLTGFFQEYAIPTPGSNPWDIVRGPDGDMWFTESGGRIGKSTPGGAITEFVPPTTSSIYNIAVGPDGALWFAENSAHKIGRVTTAGSFSEFPVPNGDPIGITTGPDGNLWLTEMMANRIGKMTTGGTLTEFALPTAGADPYDIVAGGDGDLWFTEPGAHSIGRITTAGTITEFFISPTANPQGITEGGGGIWFTDLQSNPSGGLIGHVSRSGSISEHAPPNGQIVPTDLAWGPDKNLWFADAQTPSAVGVFLLRVMTVSPTNLTFPGTGQMQSLYVSETRHPNLWTASTSNASVATVKPAPPPAVGQFIVTSKGVGTCTILIDDTMGNFVPTFVTVN